MKDLIEVLKKGRVTLLTTSEKIALLNVGSIITDDESNGDLRVDLKVNGFDVRVECYVTFDIEIECWVIEEDISNVFRVYVNNYELIFDDFDKNNVIDCLNYIKYFKA